MNRLRMMMTLFTRFPVGGHLKWNQKEMGKGAVYLPLIGLLIGCGLVLVHQLDYLLPESTLAVFLLLSYLWMSGGLHMDGLADWSDGNFSGRIGNRMLEIMSDSRIGTFGVMAIVLYMLIFYSTAGTADWTVLLLMPVVGRTVGYWLCGTGHSAKTDGLGYHLIESVKPWQGWAMLLVVMTVAFRLEWALVFPYMAAVATGAVIHIATKKKIGGLTGDVLGASIELSQLAWLVGCYVIKAVGL